MDAQACFDFAASQAALDSAIDQVSDTDWLAECIDAIRSTARVLEAWTTDDVLRHHPHLEECPERPVLGAAILHLSRLGEIRATGQYVASSRVASHARPKRQWRAA